MVLTTIEKSNNQNDKGNTNSNNNSTSNRNRIIVTTVKSISDSNRM